MRRALTRLRWQLTLSHLVATVVTLITMIAAIAVIVTGWMTLKQDPDRRPFEDARLVAGIVGGLVLGDAETSSLNAVLRSLAVGELRLPAAYGPPWAQREGVDGFEPALGDLAYLVVLGADGRVIGSSDPAGAAFAPAERGAWSELVEAALRGERDPGALTALRSGDGPAALGAHPIVGEDGRAVAAVVVAKTALPSANRLAGFGRALLIFGAATVVVLVASFLFALVSAGLVAYLLARRLVARLERLGRGAEALAAGDLTSRVEEGPPDEVGQLARRFNHMAATLADTVAELEAERQQATTLLRAKRELVANVSHELRTPLASIRGHTESLLMQRADDESEQREYLTVIDRETERLSRLIDDLFLLATTEAGALPLTLGPVALDDVIDEVVTSFRSIAQREGRVTIVTAVAPDLPPALADRERVVQVLSNLVRNALRYTPEGGLISVRAERGSGEAVVTVEDTGVGIPPEQLPYLFERFWRGDEARDRTGGGAGLGLAIVRELVEAMGGTVAVESGAGGSRFSFALPLGRHASSVRVSAAVP